MIVKEVCVDNLDDAISAFRRGADRIELCSNLFEDGLSPSFKVLKNSKLKIPIPIRVMIRPHSKTFNYSNEDLIEMKKTIEFCKKEKFDGVVYGCLNNKLELDLKKIEYLTKLSKPLKVIIHKAIDLTLSPVESLNKILKLENVDGVLSSGGESSASKGSEILKKMIDISPNGFEMICAGKITKENLESLHRKINGRYYHGRKIVGEL
ncbi:MAG: copper homeostasis protein CutC [Bacteroidota bacterium]|nr:copper homeostasis protein CutC [Bacteroidota bacterium]